MEKMKKILSMIILLTITMMSFLAIINQNKSYAINQTISTDVNGMDSNAYPGIKEKIQNLKNKYPNWNFKLLYTDLDWNNAIINEYQGHGGSPKNLVQDASNYRGAWVCPICGNKAYDNGSWRCASEQAIKYMMDPRNSLNESDIFQFEELTLNGYDTNTVKNMTQGTFLSGHEQGIIETGTQNNVSPYYIVARLIQEQGKGGSALTSGASGYYNAFNIGASGNTEAEVINNGLAYAKKKGWTTLEASIKGGISFVADEYIKKGQNTLYLQKFNVTTASGGPYSHQYQQNVLAAQSEGTTLRKTYSSMGSLGSSHTFIIPIYKNMPAGTSARPDGNGNATIGSDLVRINVVSSLKMRKDPTKTEAVGWLGKDEIATRIQKGTNKIGGVYWDIIKKANGITGYVARETFDGETPYKLYLVPLSGESEVPNPEPEKPKYVLGDCNGDNVINSGDLLTLKKHLLGTGVITDNTRLLAMDINKDNAINSGDLLLIRKHLLGTYVIQ